MTMKILSQLITKYHRIQVVQEGAIRSLLSGVGFAREQGAIDVDDLQRHIFNYSELAMQGLEYMPAPERILIVGLGAAIVRREMRRVLPDAEIDILEVDEYIINNAKEFFFFKEDDKMKVHLGDPFVLANEIGRASCRERV